MRKLLMTGAAVLLMAGMGTKALASGQNLIAARTMKPETVWSHHYESHLQRHVGGRDCLASRGIGGFCSPAGTSGTHHAEADVDCWTDGQDCDGENCYTGKQCGAILGMESSGSCHIADGHCMNWTDCDGDEVCDVCGNPVCHENAVTGAGNGNLPSQNYGSVQPQGNGDVSQQADMKSGPADSETDKGSITGSQEQSYSGYGTGCHGSNYGDCGSSRTGGHHGSGHHGSGHHR